MKNIPKNDYGLKCLEVKEGIKASTQKKKDEIDTKIKFNLVINCALKIINFQKQFPNCPIEQ